MARLPRLVLPAHPHHLVQCGNNGQPAFLDEEDYRSYLDGLLQASRAYRVAIHAYALLPDRLHLLATPADEQGLARMMQWMGRHYVPYFNRKYGRAGTLWQGRYRTSLVEPDVYFMRCSRYIEHGPLRAGLAGRYEDWAWSSYMHHIGAKRDPVVSDHALYWALGNTPFQREAAYREFLEQALTDMETQALDAMLMKGWPLGSDRFKAGLETKLQRRVGPARRGRPSRKPAGAEPTG